MIAAVLAYLPPVLIGLLSLLIAWPGPTRRNLGVKVSLALAIGPGISSCLYFAWCLFFRPRSLAFFAGEAALLGLLLVVFWLARGRKAAFIPEESPGPVKGLPVWVWGIAAAALLLAGVNFTLQTLMQPHGIQDAWNIWNMRARFLARGGTAWTDLFSPDLYWLNHADYPFLISAGTALAWSFTRGESTLVPAVQAALYALALLGLLYFAVASRRGRMNGLLGLVILAGSPIFALLAGWQIADVPLAFFLTASLFLMLESLRRPHPGMLFLLGLCAGLAAWTKNEGIPWLIILILVYAAARLAQKASLSALVREGTAILAGTALPLANLLYLKLVLAPASDLFAGQPAGAMLAQLLDPQRYALVFSYTLKALAGFSPIGLPVLPTLPIVLALVFLFLPRKKDRAPLRGLAYALAAILLQGAAYFAIYLITPHDLVWHLRTAVDRLVFQLTPPALLLVFLAVRPVEEALAAFVPSQEIHPPSEST